jgi:hypothetical protein
MASSEYKTRAANTQRQDRHLFDELRATCGTGLLRDLRDRHVKKIRDYFRDKFTASSGMRFSPGNTAYQSPP